ncbi:hypothetical protein ACSTS3_19530 [Aquimarina muelleri]|uniref:hypothetical protein n=1 Tax=Aquimarina muelleri TaxID=279356 RepID=UPI003F689631
MKTLYTKNQLENKLEELNEQYQNTVGITEKKRIAGSLNYYITKITHFDENPTLKTIEA